MLRIVVSRLLFAIPLLLIITTFSFLLVSFIPGDPAATILGQAATPHQIAVLRTQLGLNDPLAVQYVHYLGHLLTGNLGTSYVVQPGASVASIVMTRLPVTLSLSISALIVTFVIGVLLGLLAALGGGVLGRAAQVVSLLGVSIPNFWLGVLLVLLFSISLKLLPATGYVPLGQSPLGWADSLVLPVVTLALASVAAVARQTRGAVNETLAQDYVRTLLAAGTPRVEIVFKHALRNAGIPVVSVLGFLFIGIFGGTIIIEQIFGLSGFGQLTISAVTDHDIPVIQGVVVVATIVVIIVNLVVDVLYVVLNPKAR